jgi:uncharacterized repeat protein (TIGR01451 family)
VTVTVSNLYHSLPSDIIMLLVSPATNVLLMNDVGGDNGQGVTNFSATFDDFASSYMSSNQLVSGASANNKPTAYVEIGENTVFLGNNWSYLPVLPSPAPTQPYSTNLSVLSGTAANGTWSLYVADTKPQDYGAINNGWSLNLSIGNPVPSYTDLELTVVQSPASATVGNTNVYTVALTNYGPAAATGVIITNILPPSANSTYLSNSFPGTVVSNNLVLTFNVGALAVSNGISFNITNLPSAQTTVTNAFIAISDQLEASTNNATNVVTAIGAPSADLGVTMNVVPNPVAAGGYVTITLVVTNSGPSSASGTTVSNYLPEGLVLTANSSSLGWAVTGAGSNVWNGSLPPNGSVTMTLTAQAAAAAGGTFPDSVEVSSPVYDPFKLNNFASYKIVINPAPSLSIVPGVSANTFTWSATGPNFALLGATNLTEPIIWVTVTNPAPTLANGQYSVALPTNSPLHFFMLSTP